MTDTDGQEDRQDGQDPGTDPGQDQDTPDSRNGSQDATDGQDDAEQGAPDYAAMLKAVRNEAAKHRQTIKDRDATIAERDAEIDRLKTGMESVLRHVADTAAGEGMTRVRNPAYLWALGQVQDGDNRRPVTVADLVNDDGDDIDRHKLDAVIRDIGRRHPDLVARTDTGQGRPGPRARSGEPDYSILAGPNRDSSGRVRG